MPQSIPSDIPAEGAVLGAMLLHRECIGPVCDIIGAEYFYKPLNGHIFAAIRTLHEDGAPIDAVTVEGEMARLGLGGAETGANMVKLTAETPAFDVQSALAYAKQIERAKIGRDVMRAAQDALSSVTEGSDPFEASHELINRMMDVGQKDVFQQAQTIPEMMASDDAISRTLIPQLLMVDHRVIITAKPGVGKSTLLKQIGYPASQGVHPFTHWDMTPIRVLVLDTENPALSVLQTMEPLRTTLMERSGVFDDSRFRVFRRPGGMNLRKHRDRSALQREIALHKPDLLCAGPVYKLTRREGSESWEAAAEGFIDVIDDLRTRYEFAVILEAHVSKGSMDMTPQGSVILSQWSEVGLAMSRDDQDPRLSRLEPFRYDRVQGLGWPNKLYWDDDWIFRAGFS